jgi:hypothetical protein
MNHDARELILNADHDMDDPILQQPIFGEEGIGLSSAGNDFEMDYNTTDGDDHDGFTAEDIITNRYWRKYFYHTLIDARADVLTFRQDLTGSEDRIKHGMGSWRNLSRRI